MSGTELMLLLSRRLSDLLNTHLDCDQNQLNVFPGADPAAQWC